MTTAERDARRLRPSVRSSNRARAPNGLRGRSRSRRGRERAHGTLATVYSGFPVPATQSPRRADNARREVAQRRATPAVTNKATGNGKERVAPPSAGGRPFSSVTSPAPGRPRRCGVRERDGLRHGRRGDRPSRPLGAKKFLLFEELRRPSRVKRPFI